MMEPERHFRPSTRLERTGYASGTAAQIGLSTLTMMLLVIRIGLWKITRNYDLQIAFLPWQAFLIEHGRWRALAHPIGDYFPAYFDIAALTSYLDGSLSRAAQIKLISFSFDLIAAAAAYLVVRRCLRDAPATSSKLARMIIAPFCILAGPTVILNGSMWGQTDIVYTTFLFLTVLAVVEGYSATAVLFFGFALAFKLQAIFFAPFLAALLLQRRIRIYQLWPLPVGWVVAVAPAFLQRTSPLPLLALAPMQSQEFRSLAINVGNPWIFAEGLGVDYHRWLIFGLALTIAVGAGLSILGARMQLRSGSSVLSFAAITLLTMPYIMPKMHDRYFFPAEVFLAVTSCIDGAFALPAALVTCGSLLAYLNYFQAHIQFSMLLPAFVGNSIALALVYRRLWSDKTNRIRSAAPLASTPSEQKLEA